MINNIDFLTLNNYYTKNELFILVNSLGQNVEMPNETHNYIIFDKDKVNRIVSYGEKTVPYIERLLKKSSDEKQICEALYVLDRMCELNVKNIDKTYGTISRFNYTSSPNIQVLLAGIYRKTQVPDSFGPLINMLINNSKNGKYPYFDPSEEIGGAILEYIKNYSSKSVYS